VVEFSSASLRVLRVFAVKILVMSGITYEQSGVRYDRLDAFKRACQRAAAGTVSALASHDLREVPGIRGESAYLLEAEDEYLAHVEEGLGTKNLVADKVAELTGKSYYRNIGIDTVATIVNDLITVGALPISVAMHAAVGDDAWFADENRAAELAAGFAEGCGLAGAVWGGGETPTLRSIVCPGAISLAGSALGRIRPKSHRITGNVREGDAIIFLASSGVHTNGLTLCRAIADKLPNGYQTPVGGGDGRTLGEALLDPSIIYVKYLATLANAGIIPHYAVHVTGHGWRKLMRLDAPFVYRIESLRPPPPVFALLTQSGPIDPTEAYATFNMGVGFAVYVDPTQADRCVQLANGTGYTAWRAGIVAAEGGRKAVVIGPLGITYDAKTLQVR
jgi:phosphoribosylformylglycinamidine cyclo-ligase